MSSGIDKISVEFLVESKTHPRRIVSVSPKDDVLGAAKVLKEANVGIALVMEGEKLVGVLSERDIVRRWVSNPKFPSSMLVQDIMTRKVEFVTALDNVRDCYLRFGAVGCRHLPVLDPMMQVMGVLSIRDVADYMVRELSKNPGPLTPTKTPIKAKSPRSAKGKTKKR